MTGETQTQEQGTQQFAPFYSPQTNHMGNMLYLTDPTDILGIMERRIRGQELVGGEVKDVRLPLLNDKGVNEVMMAVSGVVSRDTYVTNLDEEHVASLVNTMRDVLIELLMQNRYTYQIQNDTDRTNVMFICLSMGFMALRRGYKEGDRRFFKGSTMEMNYGYANYPGGGGGQSSTFGGVPQGQKKGSMLNPMNWWGG